jgi:hypothetical protein
MTTAEAITFLNGITPVNVNMVTLDATLWADFKASMLTFLAAPGADPKWEATVRAIDALDNAALK